MSHQHDDLKSLLEKLKSGAPSERGFAALSLAKIGPDAELPVARLMISAEEPQEIGVYLEALSQFERLSYASTVDAIVQRLSNSNVRGAAAECLLKTSPKLRRHIPLIRAIHERETHEWTRGVLQKLLDRYPAQAG
jgi:hypothetical protein